MTALSKGFASTPRMILLAAGVLGAFATVGVRLVHLHVIDRDSLVHYLDRARHEIIVEKARRGDILDAHDDILATSHSLIVLGVDPQLLEKADESKWPELARLINVPLPELSRIFNTKTRPASAGDGTDEEGRIRWAKLSDSVEESVYDAVGKLGVKGVYGDRVYRRAYPHNQLAAHVIGYVNKEEEPVIGMERFADFYLRGVDGWRESEKDGQRHELAQFRTREVPASNGYAVVLSIDSAIQHMVEQELELIAGKFQPQKASIIVSDARSGFIYAMANYPTFDLNAYNALSKDGERAMRNAAVADILEPGSTFKIVAVSGALNEGLVTPETRFDCSLEKVDYKGVSRSLPREDHHFDAPLSVTEIISHSSNKGAAQLGMLLGEERLYGYARAYGFAEDTGLASIYPESPGMLANYTKWSGSDITRIPMGHTVAATPLQIHMAMGVIASGGVLLRPQLVREIRDDTGATVCRFGTVVRRRVISPQTAATMAQMLERVTYANEGTAPEAAIPNFEAAGKTGTTEKLIDGKYSTTHHISSFVGFFPASRPRLVISVIVDDGHPPQGGTAYGRLVAAPSFKHLGEQLIQYLDIKPVTTPVPGLLALGGARP